MVVLRCLSTLTQYDLFVSLFIQLIMMFKFIIWNYQGIGKKMFSVMVANLVKLHKPSIFVIVEPRISGRVVDRAIKKLGFSRSHRVETIGFIGGIWFIWQDKAMTFEILLNRKQFIHNRISKNKESICL